MTVAGAGKATAGPVSLDDLLADEAAWLTAQHGRLVATGTPGPAAATYLAGWIGGSVAQQLGHRLAVDGVGYLIDRSELRFWMHAGGWPERVEFGDCPAVGVSGDEIRQVVEALVAVCSPLISACRRLARVGRVGLWNEVGDRLAMALAYQTTVSVTPAMVAVLEAAWSVPGAPWRARPRLAFARSPILGRVHVAQKGGCCLSYTTPHLDGPPYCEHCPFRSPQDCDAAQVAWLEHQSSQARAASG